MMLAPVGGELRRQTTTHELKLLKGMKERVLNMERGERIEGVIMK